MKYYTYFFLVIFALLPSSRMISCSCAYQPEGVKKMNQYDHIFLGEVIEKKGVQAVLNEQGDTIRGMIGTDYYQYTFQIDQPIKGVFSSTQILVYSSTQGSACGVNYQPGDQFYIYSYDWKGVAFTGLCCENRMKKNAKRKYRCMIKQFMKGKKERAWKNLDGNLEALGKIVNKRAEGKWLYYHPGGTIKSEGVYMNRVSSERFLKENPQIKLEAQMDPKHLLQRILIYEDGEIIKSQTVHG